MRTNKNLQNESDYSRLINEENKVCPECKYIGNPAKATNCIICQTSLTTSNAKARKRTNDPNNVQLLPFHKRKKKDSKTTKIWKTLILALKKVNLARASILPKSAKKELSKPINLIGLLAIGLGISLWANQFFNFPTQNKAKEGSNIIVKKPDRVNTVQGLFDYGGVPYYASLVSGGLNTIVEKRFPGLELRYTKPLNNDFSNSMAVQMLLDDLLTVAYTGRPLNDEEYQKAKLRNIELEQVPIGLDAIVFFGNNNESVNQLNLEQVRQIFTGELTNWNQINPNAPDLLIIPILTDDESLELLGIDSVTSQASVATQYAPNHTQLMRKVIATTGAISFSSASLVKNQQLIKVMDLADNDSFNFVSAFKEGQPNFQAFKNGTYPLTRKLFVAYKKETGSLDQKAGEIYTNCLLTEEGQLIVEKSGFLPIR